MPSAPQDSQDMRGGGRLARCQASTEGLSFGIVPTGARAFHKPAMINAARWAALTWSG
jgi:hypothetical protein